MGNKLMVPGEGDLSKLVEPRLRRISQPMEVSAEQVHALSKWLATASPGEAWAIWKLVSNSMATSKRLHTPGVEWGCVLQCGCPIDDAAHLLVCPVLWKLAHDATVEYWPWPVPSTDRKDDVACRICLDAVSRFAVRRCAVASVTCSQLLHLRSRQGFIPNVQERRRLFLMSARLFVKRR